MENGEIAHYEKFLLFPLCFLPIWKTFHHFFIKFKTVVCKLFQICSLGNGLSLPERQVLDSSKPKEFADDNFKFVENGRKLPKQVENTVGKGEIARYKQFLLFPQCFLKTLTANT